MSCLADPNEAKEVVVSEPLKANIPLLPSLSKLDAGSSFLAFPALSFHNGLPASWTGADRADVVAEGCCGVKLNGKDVGASVNVIGGTTKGVWVRALLEAKKCGMLLLVFARSSAVDETSGTESTFGEISGSRIGAGGVEVEGVVDSTLGPFDDGIGAAPDTEKVPDWKEDMEKGNEGMGGSLAFDKSNAIP